MRQKVKRGAERLQTIRLEEGGQIKVEMLALC